MGSTAIPGILKGHTGPVYALAAGRNDTSIFSGGSDGHIVEWNYSSLRQEGLVVKVSDAIFSLRFDPIHQLILAGTGGGKIHVIDVKAGVEIRCLDYHSKGIFDFVFSEKGDELIALGGDGLVSCWTYPDFTPLRRIGISDSKCRQVAHVPKSDSIVIGTSRGEIVFCNPSSGEITGRFLAHEAGLSSLNIHPFKPALITGGRDAHLNVWNLHNAHEKLLSMPAHNFAIYSIQFSPDNSLMATASRDKSIKLWDSASLELAFKLDHKEGGHTRSVNQLRWINDQQFASCSDDGKVIIWKMV